jgi:hypothetical protein
MKVPAGVTIHKGGMVYREGDDWPPDHPVPDHVRKLAEGQAPFADTPPLPPPPPDLKMKGK